MKAYWIDRPMGVGVLWYKLLIQFFYKKWDMICIHILPLNNSKLNSSYVNIKYERISSWVHKYMCALTPLENNYLWYLFKFTPFINE